MMQNQITITAEQHQATGQQLAAMIKERQQVIEYLQQLDRQIAETTGAYNYMAQQFQAAAKAAEEPASEPAEEK